MRKILATTAIILATSTYAQAQDWDRWFVGFDAGYIARQTTVVSTSNNTATDYPGFAVGLTVGRWWQFDPITLGFDMNTTFAGSTTSTNPNYTVGWMLYDSIDVVTITPRFKIGIPIGSTLPYFAIGPQYIHALSKIYSSTPFPARTTETWGVRGGVNAAVGIEQKIQSNFAVKGEVGVNLFWGDATADYSGWHAKAGVNYYF